METPCPTEARTLRGKQAACLCEEVVEPSDVDAGIFKSQKEKGHNGKNKKSSGQSAASRVRSVSTCSFGSQFASAAEFTESSAESQSAAAIDHESSAALAQSVSRREF